MNCKAGDLAVCVRESKYGHIIGKIVECLYIAPGFRHYLPDGFLSEAGGGNSWVVKVPNPMEVKLNSMQSRMTNFVVIPDPYLKPIRPGDLDESIDEAAPIHDGVVI